MDKDTRKYLIRAANMSSMGIALGVTIFGCFFIGLYLDRKFGTGYLFTFIFLLLGIFAGFKNIYGLIKSSIENEKPLDQEDKSEKHKTAAKKD